MVAGAMVTAGAMDIMAVMAVVTMEDGNTERNTKELTGARLV